MLCRLVKRLKVNNHDRDDDNHHQVSCTSSDDAALPTRDHLENCLATLATVPKTEELEVPTKKANTMLNARTLFPKLVLPDLELTDSSSESDDDDKRDPGDDVLMPVHRLSSSTLVTAWRPKN